MKVTNLDIEGLKLIELTKFEDERGFFTERYNSQAFKEAGLPEHFVQDNFSRSKPNVLRGLHFQRNPGQGKLVSVLRGAIWDVAVDIRPESSTFGKHFALELSEANGYMFWIPSCFAHGFYVTSSEPADVLYKVDHLYNPDGDSGIIWNDFALSVPWPTKQQPIISKKDCKLGSLKDALNVYSTRN